MQCGSISVARSVVKILAFEDFVLPLIIKTFNISDKLPVKINQNHNQESQMHISNDGEQIILITDQDNALLINLEKRDKEHIVEEDCSNVVIGSNCGSKFLAVNRFFYNQLFLQIVFLARSSNAKKKCPDHKCL